MKPCPSCNHTIFRDEPETAEYGVPIVDGRRYPDRCPHCDVRLEEPEE